MTHLILTTPDELRSIVRDAVREELAKVKAQPVPVPTPDDELTTRDVCALLKVSKKTLWAWRRRDVNPFPAPRRVSGAAVRYLRADVDEFRRNLQRVSRSAA